MTLEQIKTSIKRTIDQAYERDDRNVVIVLNNVITMLDQLEPSWHEYPREKPPKDGPYLVTWGNEYPIVGKFEEGTFCFDHVVAWAELPKPYKKGIEK